MQTINGQLVYSATDLVGFLACEHLTNLDRAATAGLIQRPMRVDPELDRIAKRGLQHEARFLAELEASGLSIAQVDNSELLAGQNLRQAADATLDAMHRGVDVIYQAALFEGQRQGRPDFLIKVDVPSDLGAWSYEIWDTKLARHAKGSALLQMCLYSDLLTVAQGLQPERMYLALGGSKQEKVEFRVADYAAYYRLVKADFEHLLGSGTPAYPPSSRPDPVEHCEVCRWSEACRSQLRATDDLSLVASISSNQRRHLRERDVTTRTALAGTSLPLNPPLRGSTAEGVTRVHEQARIQVEGEQKGKVIFELLDLPRTREGEYQTGLGLLSLPPQSPGDLFFDIEGDPFAFDDGIDYLFGVLEPSLLDSEGQPTVHSFWSIEANGEATLDAERKAFEAFIDLVMLRLEADPNLHIYHYAAYEQTAVRRLMGRYGTREDEVDRLLRGGVFVDLFRAVRQGIRASVESYSIKKLEPLYGFTRTVDLRDAGSSIVAFETWLELGGEVEDDPEILQRIEEYNKDDCVSTWRLRDWLETLRTQLAADLGGELPRPAADSGTASEELTQLLALTLELTGKLVAGVSEDPSSRSAEEQGRRLLAQLLSWHRREEKSMWWRYFYLVNDLTDEERVAEPDAMGDLIADGPVGQERQSIIYRFRFPPQDHKITVGSTPRDPAQDGQRVGTVVAIDDDSSTIEIKRGRNADPPSPTSLVPLEDIRTPEQQANLRRIAEWVIDNGIDAAGPFRAARDLLLRKPPNAGQPNGDRLASPDEPAEAAARRLVAQLDASYLAVQGPPGSGKTTVGAEMIVDLAAAGKRVGVTATSHKVIGQLLEKTAEAAAKRGVAVRIGQRHSHDEPPTFADAIPFVSPGAARDSLTAGEVDVVGGTTWLWCRDDMQEAVDVLFVDEAGQMSLANVVAASSAARSLVLLGDPQQLDQPLQGVHPPGAGVSALAHVLGDHRTSNLTTHNTMPPELGLFLDGTWRLHPNICAYTSEVFYDGLLHSRPGRDRQHVSGRGTLSGAGVRFVPVQHEGHSSESEEEAERIAQLVSEVLASNPTWRDAEGNEQVLTPSDIVVVTPYNAQVGAIAGAFPGLRVGTVDKFQGQEAAISIYSMATSSCEDAPRGMEFLYSLNRLNVATSRARCLAVVVASPDLVRVRCRTPRQMVLANALARLVEVGGAD